MAELERPEARRDDERNGFTREPLLPSLAADRVLDSAAPRRATATVSSAVYNLTTTIIGAGIMGLPSKMKVLGVPAGIAFLVLMGYLTEHSVELMMRCSARAQAWTYAELMDTAYGRTGRDVVRFFIIIFNIGIMIIYLIIIGDVLSESGDGEAHFPGVLEGWAGGPTWWNSRTAVILGTTGAVLAPLCCLKHVDSLQWSSLLAVLLAVVFVVITVGVAVVRLVQGSIDFEGLHMLPQMGSTAEVFQLFTVVPTMATAYVCHYSVHPITAEMMPPRLDNLRAASRISLALCTLVYVTTSVFGYLLFGEATQADVLANFYADLGVWGSAVLCDVVRTTYAVHLMLVFPVVSVSLRGNVDSWIFPRARILTEDYGRLLAVSVSLIALIVVAALFLPSIQSAFNFTGALAAVSLTFTCPGLAAISEATGLPSTSERSAAWAMIVIGLVCTLTGLSTNIFWALS